MNTKKDLESIYPKDSLYLIGIYGFSLMAILFDLSWKGVLVTVVIDNLAYFLSKKLEINIFYLLNPQFQGFKNLDEALVEARSLEEQNKLFNLLAQFPEKRSLYVFFGSLLKVLPAGLFIAYASEITSSFWENLFLFYVADIFILFYCSGLLFIQLHTMTSDIMADVLKNDSWEKNYRELELDHMSDRFSVIQNSLLVLMLMSLLGLVTYTLTLNKMNPNYFIFLLFVISLVCIGRVQLLFQGFFKKSIDRTFLAFEHLIVHKKPEILPLHTSPLLASFEFTFNQLGRRLEDREREIALWLKHESGQFHFRTLGEVTAMVAHDMKTPLSIMKMALDMLNMKTVSEENKKKYFDMLERNLEQSLSFSNTLMAYVRGDKGSVSCRFNEIHVHLMDLFKNQFSESDLEKIKFKISDELMDVAFKMSRLDAMHVFYNLYQNGIKATLTSEEPGLNLWSEKRGGMVDIFIHNSGPQLSLENFQNLVSFERFYQDGQFQHGLGLRLTNSILGQVKGQLDLVGTENGTCFKVTLMMNQEQPFSDTISAVSQASPEVLVRTEHSIDSKFHLRT